MIYNETDVKNDAFVSVKRRLSEIHQEVRKEQKKLHLPPNHERPNPEDGRNDVNPAYLDDAATTPQVVKDCIQVIPSSSAIASSSDVHEYDATQYLPKKDFKMDEPLIPKCPLRIDNIGSEKRCQDVAKIKVESQSDFVQERSQMKQISTEGGRLHMNALLKVQIEANEAILKARKLLSQAKFYLEQCDNKCIAMDQAVINRAEIFSSVLLQEDSPWNRMYFTLAKYKEIHGDCNVKHALLQYQQTSNPTYSQLGCWVKNIRKQVERAPDDPGWLEPYQVVALNRLEFEWQPEDFWIENYLMLKAYMEEHGKGQTPNKQNHVLGSWCSDQIAAYKKYQAGITSDINNEGIFLLEEIGFIWDHQSGAWLEGYASLQKYHKMNNHCRVSRHCGDMVLFRWVVKERRKYRNYVEKKKPAQTKVQWDLLNDIAFFHGFHVPTHVAPSGLLC